MLVIITLASLLLATVMTVVAWRAARDQRRRSDARVELLAREIHGMPMQDLDLRATPLQPALTVAGSDESHAVFGSSLQRTDGGSRWGLGVAIGAFVMASVAAVVVVFGGDRFSTPAAARVATTPELETHPTVVAPLELVALEHERQGDQLTVRGVVRNPPTGAEMDRLVAVVSLFDRDGQLLTNGRAPVASSALIPGGESTFAVTVRDAADVGRYRVSFRSDERVVSHVDKRTGA